jgi:hypothetical protein
VSGYPHVDDQALNDWCREHLGAQVAGRVFTAGNLSAVYGLRLVDDREVVLKVRGGGPRLDACLRVQHRMWEAGFPCPELLAGPHRLGSATASAEALLPEGGQPALQDAPRLSARLLARFVECADGLAPEPDLRPADAWVCWYHEENGVWPVPDDRDVDLNAERCPATAWVDELGAAVRERGLPRCLPARAGASVQQGRDPAVLGRGPVGSRVQRQEVPPGRLRRARARRGGDEDEAGGDVTAERWDLDRIRRDFVAAAERSVEAGLDGVALLDVRPLP